MRILKKIFKWFLGTILVLAMAVGCFLFLSVMREQVNNKPLYGTLELQEAIPTFEHSAGKFVFNWNEEDLQLSIHQHDQPEKIQWASAPGESFLHASLGSSEFSETRGSYFIRNKIRKRFTLQRLDELRTVP